MISNSVKCELRLTRTHCKRMKETKEVMKNKKNLNLKYLKKEVK